MRELGLPLKKVQMNELHLRNHSIERRDISKLDLQKGDFTGPP